MRGFISQFAKGKTQGEKNTRHLGKCRNRQPRMEFLEDRCLLAVGTFWRINGNVGAAALANAVTPASSPPTVSNFDAGDADETFALAAAGRNVSDEYGTGISHEIASAVAQPAVGDGLSGPFVTSAVSENRTAAGQGVTAYGGGAASALSELSYQADPQFSEALQLHGFLYLVGSFVGVKTDNAFFSDDHGPSVGAQIGNAHVNAAFDQGTNRWSYSGFVPGFGDEGNVSGTVEGPILNLVYPFVTDIIDEQVITISSFAIPSHRFCNC